jgi:plasmid stabilization system protein ParE
VLAIKHSVALLTQPPALGRPGRILGTRELVVPDTPYLVPYQIKIDEVQILRVFHGSRKRPKKL